MPVVHNGVTFSSAKGRHFIKENAYHNLKAGPGRGQAGILHTLWKNRQHGLNSPMLLPAEFCTSSPSAFKANKILSVHTRKSLKQFLQMRKPDGLLHAANAIVPSDNCLTGGSWFRTTTLAKTIIDTLKAELDADVKCQKAFQPKVMTFGMETEWAIGIFIGPDPFNIHESPNVVSNPIITSHDISDFRCSFLADPFLAHEGDSWYLFAEAWHHDQHVGIIVVFSSFNLRDWQYLGPVTFMENHASSHIIHTFSNTMGLGT